MAHTAAAIDSDVTISGVLAPCRVMKRVPLDVIIGISRKQKEVTPTVAGPYLPNLRGARRAIANEVAPPYSTHLPFFRQLETSPPASAPRPFSTFEEVDWLFRHGPKCV